MTEAISEPDELEGEILPGLVAKVVKVPPNLPARHTLRERFDDRSIAVSKAAGAIWIEVWTSSGESLAACATFAADHQVVRCDTIDVTPDHRRKGLATALYQLASGLFAAPVVPSETLSDDAKLFWAGRTQIVVD